MRLLHPLQTYMAHNWKIFNRIKPDIRLISAESAKMCTGEEEGPKKQQNRELPVPNKNLTLDAKQMGGIMEVLLNEPNSLGRREEELKKRVRRSGVKAKVGVVFRAFEERGEREAVLMEVGWKFNRFLPPGWMCREAEPKRVKILNPQGKVLISIQQVGTFSSSSSSRPLLLILILLSSSPPHPYPPLNLLSPPGGGPHGLLPLLHQGRL